MEKFVLAPLWKRAAAFVIDIFVVAFVVVVFFWDAQSQGLMDAAAGIVGEDGTGNLAGGGAGAKSHLVGAAGANGANSNLVGAGANSASSNLMDVTGAGANFNLTSVANANSNLAGATGANSNLSAAANAHPTNPAANAHPASPAATTNPTSPAAATANSPAALTSDQILTLVAASNAFSRLILIYFAVELFYQVFFVATFGATLGKMALRLRCVSLATAQKPLFVPALIRALVRIASQQLFYVGCVWAVFSPLRQTWHDIAAKVVVCDASR